MRKYCFILFALLTGCQSMPEATIPMPQAKVIKADKPSNAMEKAILDRHNYYRVLGGETPLFWNKEIAYNAYKWAKELQAQGCAMKHSSEEFRTNKAGFNYLGENLFWEGSSIPLVMDYDTMNESVDSWYDEIANYQYSKTGDFEACPIRAHVSQGQIGHFTQLMWENSKALGCAAVQCDDNKKLLVVCQYGEGGNVIGRKAFSEKVREKLNHAPENQKFGGLPVCH